MNYLIMETHPAYAVLLGSDGSMLKCANLGYAVGQHAADPVIMNAPKKVSHARKRLGVLAAAAACLCLIYFGAWRPNFVPYGTVRMKINPDVLMSVSRTGRVVKLTGLNGDGETLIKGYTYYGKKQADAAAELMETASREGFLKDGGSVKLTVNSGDGDWSSETAGKLEETMGQGVAGKTVTIFISLGGGEPKLVITAGGGTSKTWSYSDWSAAQSPSASSPSQSIGDWGEKQGDEWEQWGEKQGDDWEDFGESVGGIFDDGYQDGDLNSLFRKIQEKLG